MPIRHVQLVTLISSTLHQSLSNCFIKAMAECAVSWTEDLKVGSSIPTVAQGYLIFPAQKDERHQGQLHSPGVVR